MNLKLRLNFIKTSRQSVGPPQPHQGFNVKAYREGIKIYQELNDLDKVARLYALAD